jgi:hypothetical protein
MAKKIVRVTIVAEIEVDLDSYPEGQRSDEDIKFLELNNWPEWICDILCDIKSEKCEVFDPQHR